jgi:osmotically-inducible protein OsmY
MLKQRLFLVKFLVCVGLITAFLGCEATQKTESTGQGVDDAVITTKIKTAIFQDPSLKTLQIDIKTYKGTVQLSGFVDSALNVQRAGEIAGKVAGITQVKNDLVAK